MLVAGGLVVLGCLGVGAGLAGASGASPDRPVERRQTPEAVIERGRALFQTSCATCHGPNGTGRTGPNGRTSGEAVGPSVTESGAAGAYYQLSTGRMPLADATGPAQRKPPVFDADDTAALVAFVASLGDGPALPPTDASAGDLAVGGELFRANCAPCHSAAGSGGALSYGDAAPSLHLATAPEVGAALRFGPGQMPRFGESTLSDAAVDDIARYVAYLRDPDDRGGLPLGRTGPVPEGLVAWVVGIGSLIAAVFWIGTRSAWRRPDDTPSEVT